MVLVINDWGTAKVRGEDHRAQGGRLQVEPDWRQGLERREDRPLAAATPATRSRRRRAPRRDPRHLARLLVHHLDLGRQPSPVAIATYRAALESYVAAGDKLLIEGGEVGYDAISSPGYPTFAANVLHGADWQSDNAGSPGPEERPGGAPDREHPERASRPRWESPTPATVTRTPTTRRRTPTWSTGPPAIPNSGWRARLRRQPGSAERPDRGLQLQPRGAQRHAGGQGAPGEHRRVPPGFARGRRRAASPGGSTCSGARTTAASS